jgi:hypothetical protein
LKRDGESVSSFRSERAEKNEVRQIALALFGGWVRMVPKAIMILLECSFLIQ